MVLIVWDRMVCNNNECVFCGRSLRSSIGTELFAIRYKALRSSLGIRYVSAGSSQAQR